MTNFTIDIQAIATDQLYCHLEQQVHEIAPEPVDPVADRIRCLRYETLRNALAQGEYFWQVKQSFKRLKDFKIWLERQEFTWKNACKLIKLYQTFAEFPLEQIGWLSLDTLFALLQPKYKALQWATAIAS